MADFESCVADTVAGCRPLFVNASTTQLRARGGGDSDDPWQQRMAIARKRVMDFVMPEELRFRFQQQLSPSRPI
jgi:hypothetical protein